MANKVVRGIREGEGVGEEEEVKGGKNTSLACNVCPVQPIISHFANLEIKTNKEKMYDMCSNRSMKM